MSKNGSEISLNQARFMKNVAAIKGGILSAAGKENGEQFIGRNIEVILEGLLEGWTEEETISKCEWINK